MIRRHQHAALETVCAVARFQPVQTGGADEHGVLVRSGLETGQALVADSAGVRANQAVRAAVRP